MRSKLRYLLSFCVYVCLFFVLSRANILMQISPFAFALLFALAWANQNVIVISSAYLIANLANFFTFESAVISVVTIFALLVPYYIHYAVKKPMKKWEVFVYAGLSQSAWFVFSILNGVSVVAIFAYFLIGLVIVWIATSVFEPIILRGLRYKLTLRELICLSIILMILGCGLSNCDLYGFSFLKLFVAISLLILSNVSNLTYTFIFASAIGIGAMLPGNNPIFVAPFIMWSLSVVVFKSYHKIFSCLSLVISEMLVALYFSLYYNTTILTFIPVLLACVIFMCIPKSILRQLSTLLSDNSERLAMKNLLNRNREVLQRRLNNLSEVFFDMNDVFKKLIRKNASEEEVKEMLYQEVKNVICQGCPDNKHCHRTFNDDTKKLFKELITIALTRGKITLLDLPMYLSSRCSKAKTLITEINTLTKQYKSYAELVGNIDTSKLLIADQLEGISGLMKNLAGEVDTMISIDSGKEKKLIDSLSANNIVCSDAIIYQKDIRTTMATLVVRDEDTEKLKIQTITSKVCGNKMVVYDNYPTEKAGLVAVNLRSAPLFDCIFGVAVIPKGGNSISGDRYTVERIDGEKFVFAICDGMGSGEKAGEKSETAISLVENFYKAGFNNEIILSSVNKLLNLEKDDIFSTIDICTIDLKNGIADFVKMGASSSYVRTEEGCDIIECTSLPMGVLDDVKTVTKKIVLRNKDFIIMCSDGVNDAFESDALFKDFILTIKTANPQEYADQILEKALSMNKGYAVDDMTILVIKIF